MFVSDIGRSRKAGEGAVPRYKTKDKVTKEIKKINRRRKGNDKKKKMRIKEIMSFYIPEYEYESHICVYEREGKWHFKR